MKYFTKDINGVNYVIRNSALIMTFVNTNNMFMKEDMIAKGVKEIFLHFYG